MADKYLKTGSSGYPSEHEANVTSAGVGDAGKIIALDAGGKLDPTLFPAGFGEDALLIDASENLAAGDKVNIWNDGGSSAVRKADASNGRIAHGFTLVAVTSGNPATIYGLGQINDQLSGLTIGDDYFLGAAGAVTDTFVHSPGYVVQYLGTAHSATAMRFVQSTPIVLA